MPADKICRGCSKPAVKALSCSKCNLHFHPSCARKTNLLSTDGELSCCFTASDVSHNEHKQPDLDSILPQIIKQILSESIFIDMIRTSISIEINKILSAMSTMKDDISALSARVATIESSIANNTKSNSGRLASASDSNSHSPMEVEHILQELAERERCLTNLVCYKVEENNDPDPAKRMLADKQTITSAIQTFSKEDISAIKLIRLGKKKQNVSRPLKIILQNSSQVKNILRDLPNYKGPYRFAPDQIRRQREYYKVIRSNLQTLQKNGDSSKRIKFIRGVPTIVDKQYAKSSANLPSSSSMERSTSKN